MTGQELVELIQQNQNLLVLDVKETIRLLLQKRLINPSVLIDTQFDLLHEEKERYRLHYIEGNICANLLMMGNKEQRDWAKLRAKYNSLDDETMVYKYDLSEEELKQCEYYFKLMYGFKAGKR